MKRVGLLLVVMLTGAMFLVSTAAAQDFPATPSQDKRPPQLTKAEAQQRLFYGYVPPPPIQHTWPGGYRVIMHELFTTLTEHILGWY